MTHSDKPLVYRLTYLKNLHNRQRILSIFSLMFALTGIILMIIQIEFLNYSSDKKSQFVQSILFLIRTTVSVFTVFLLITIILYHRACICLFMAENNVKHWRLVLTVRRCSMILIELVICLVHPIPIPNYNYIWQTFREYEDEFEMENIPVDVIVTIVMFARGYLVLRVLILHSQIYDKSAHRCVELLHNNRTLTSQFALKYLLTVHSKTFLIASAIGLISWTSWAVRICEMYEYKTDFNYFNNIWFIAITFFTIGYGEIVPKSTCGRFVAVLTGTLGVAYTAYVVAVIAENLQLTYSEACLHQFVVKTDLEKRMREQAARIVQCFWRIRRGHCGNDKRVTEVRLQLLTSKHKLKMLKNEQIQLETKSLRMSRICNNQSQIEREISKIQSRLDNVEKLVFAIEHRIVDGSRIKC